MAKNITYKNIEEHALYGRAQAVVEAARQSASLISDMMKQSGLTQAQLGKKLRISQPRISQLIAGKVETMPSLRMLASIANACGFKLDFSLTAKEGRVSIQPLPTVKPDRFVLRGGKFSSEIMAKDGRYAQEGKFDPFIRRPIGDVTCGNKEPQQTIVNKKAKKHKKLNNI